MGFKTFSLISTSLMNMLSLTQTELDLGFQFARRLSNKWEETFPYKVSWVLDLNSLFPLEPSVKFLGKIVIAILKL